MLINTSVLKAQFSVKAYKFFFFFLIPLSGALVRLSSLWFSDSSRRKKRWTVSPSNIEFCWPLLLCPPVNGQVSVKSLCMEQISTYLLTDKAEKMQFQSAVQWVLVSGLQLRLVVSVGARKEKNTIEPFEVFNLVCF